MDTIDKLIKALQETKEELNKNMNCAPGASTPNMDKADAVRPDAGFGKVTVKDTRPKDEQDLTKDAADPKLAPKDVKVKALQGQIDAGTYKPDASKIAGKMLSKEELTCSENGQWNLKTDA